MFFDQISAEDIVFFILYGITGVVPFLAAVFVVYYIFALRQYGRWLRDNYADLEHKEVWQSLVFAVVLLAVYMVYTSNAGELMREYLSQVISIVIIVFLVWRVETLQELEEN